MEQQAKYRINELARIAKIRPLTGEEEAERAELRQKVLKAFNQTQNALYAYLHAIQREGKNILIEEKKISRYYVDDNVFIEEFAESTGGRPQYEYWIGARRVGVRSFAFGMREPLPVNDETVATVFSEYIRLFLEDVEKE